MSNVELGGKAVFGKESFVQEEESAFLHEAVSGAGLAVGSVDMPQGFKFAGEGVGVRYIPLERVREVWEGNIFVFEEEPENLNVFLSGLRWVLRSLELQACELSLKDSVPGKEVTVLADELAQVCKMVRYAQELAKACTAAFEESANGCADLGSEPNENAGADGDCEAREGVFCDAMPVDGADKGLEGFHGYDSKES